MTLLRQRMTEEMQIRNLSTSCQKTIATATSD